jgi:uncharacterized protein YdiU (UPF0061 family)
VNARLPLAPHATPTWRSDDATLAWGEVFSLAQAPQALPDPHWVACNDALCAALGWPGWLQGDVALRLLSGQAQPPGGTRASVYSGHQFGAWAGQLGDGRALLLGQSDTLQGSMELQLKGSGRTPFSRRGDGRAVLRSSIREYLCSEALHGLGIPTTRALALVGSPLPVQRETTETAAVLTRVAPSFLRFGHFEHFAHTAPDADALQGLVQLVIRRHYPELQTEGQPGVALLAAVTRRTAALLAQWQAVGFCHGVMNTDNMSMLGLTLDYGPFGFLDAYDPGHICNHSDPQGRYAYARQPAVALWNLHALAHALRPLIPDIEDARAALRPYEALFMQALHDALCAKLGLTQPRADDAELADELLRLMADNSADFTRTWRLLSRFDSAPGAQNASWRALFSDAAACNAWCERYGARLRAEHSIDAERARRMDRVNPKFVLRNHLAEGAIRRANEGDFSEVQRLMQVLARPFDEQDRHDADASEPPPWARQLEVSCSS